jgi:hypothetical protein
MRPSSATIPRSSQCGRASTCLDDHRGEPARLTAERALIPPQMLAIIASRRAITTVPTSDADFILKVLRGVVAIPLHDAHPAVLALLWRQDNHNPLVQALAAIARNLAEGGADRRLPRMSYGKGFLAVAARPVPQCRRIAF